MKEMFTWIPWFSELAEKIAEADQESLNTRASRIEWGVESPFSSADPVEPLGLAALLARYSKGSPRRDTFLSVGRAFELRNHQLAETSDAWDLPDNWHLTAHLNPQGPDLRRAWTIFRQAVRGSVDPSAFSEALKITGIALKSLSTMLFLVNPRSFLPLVDYPTYLKILGLTSIPSRMRWKQYSSAIKQVQAGFPRCDLWEIELFSRLQRSENVGGRGMVVRPDRCWIVSTNATWGSEKRDHWNEFRDNCWVRTENKETYPVEEPETGDILLVRYGRQRGRGIGVVCRNDYKGGWTPEGRIHALWLNKEQAQLGKKTRTPAFAEASADEVASFRESSTYRPTWEVLGRVDDPESEKEPKSMRYWLMSLGRRSSRWRACYESGLASIGFDEHPVGDLHQYASLEEVGQAMKDVPGIDPRNTRLALWQFSNEMKLGDVIFVKRGQHDVVGHGTVKSQYRHVPTRERHKHVRDVNWQANFPKGRLVEAGQLLANKTLTDVTPYPDLVTALKAAAEFVDVPTREEHPPNQILYGPPGTGKTYSTVSHALAIVDGVKPDAEITEPDRQRFRRLRFKRAADSAHAEGRIAMVTFHQNYAYEDFVEGIRPALTTTDDNQGAPSTELGYELRPGIFRTICTAAQDAPDRNFVLIIDEINRGNIPKIFGELITLIEDSRRLGEDDATTVTLPYSGDAFGVPDNLYIIGTMNTADRSIQQLDTALRRRFTFVEMMPDADHELIPEAVDGVNCREMLRAMNERIAALMDREHQIGHTYLFEVKTLKQLGDRFRNRIFPLLQEYFYDDWRKIRAVLGGNAFVNERKIGEGHVKDLAQEFDLVDDERVTYERLPLDDPAWEDASEYKAIYGNADRE